MPNNRRSKQERQKERKSSRMPAPPDRKTPPDEELGPERRVEIARQVEAKRLRGRPPSI